MAQQDSNEGREVLTQLSQLRSSQLSEAEFWQALLHNIATLCHAALVMVVAKSDKGDAWQMTCSHEAQQGLTDCATPLMQATARLTDRAMANGFAFERSESRVTSMRQPVSLLVALASSVEQPPMFLALLLDRGAPSFNEMVVRAQLVADIPASYFSASGADVNNGERYLSDVLEVMSLVVHQRKFVLACMTLVNELAARFSCSQVSIGWQKKQYVRAIAISHLERIEKTSDAVQALEAIFEESCDQDEEIVWPEDADDGVITLAHEKYTRTNQVGHIVSLPMRVDGDVVAVLTCEKLDGVFSNESLLGLRLLSNQVTPWLNETYQQDRWFGGRLLLHAKRGLSQLLGVEHTWVKLLGIMFSVVLFYIVFANWTYRVEAKASLTTDHLVYLSAPFNGYVDRVNVHAGDHVKKDDVVLTFDKEELFLKSSEIVADIRRFSSEAEKARAAHAFADMRIAEARKEQAKAELMRIDYYINQSTIKASFDGVVVEGEKEQLLGAPLSKGDLIFKIAQLKGLYVTLNVPEDSIDAIQLGQAADLVLLSRPGLHIPLVIEHIIPVAKVQEGEGNVFVVKAGFTESATSWWRPGMTGVVKVDAGERSLLWILTHRTTDFLKMYFWW